MRILILNGPNLNLLGKRDPEHYGTQSLDSIIEGLREQFSEHELEDLQSNHEGELVDALQRADEEFDGVVLNAAGYTHSSVALGDTVEAIEVPVFEVHLSNIQAREDFRRHSYIAPHAVGSISGMGSEGYRIAVERLIGESS